MNIGFDLITSVLNLFLVMLKGARYRLFVKPICAGRQFWSNCSPKFLFTISQIVHALLHQTNREMYWFTVNLCRTLAYHVHIIDDSLQSSDQIRAIQSPIVRKFLRKDGFLWRAYTGPTCATYLDTIFSEGVFPLRLQLITHPFSVPTMKRVGIVPSYSRHEAPRARLKTCSSPLIVSSTNVSFGSFNFLVSHHLIF